MIVKGWCSGVCSLGLASFLTISGAIAFGENATLAQITPDSTLGSERSVVTPNANVKGLPAELIEGGALRDANLFHSFLEFNVGDGQRVYFANPAGIENILTRVTGINRSNILGTLGVDGRANLFLLNPNGIIFGTNAQLDIEGSFVASTANSLKFNDGSEFSATNPGTSSLLTISVPLGLQYGTNQAGTITNFGNLAVGKNLTLAAGNLDLQGQLYAGENLTLSALDTVRVRDSQIAPFLAMAGGQLIVQGNQGIDILALNHSQSSFQSAGDLSLISDGNISGDTHFASGGKFSILNLSGEPGNFVSLYDPIISSEGDVVFGDYTGVSLKVEATGSISAGNIKITGPDTTLTSGSDPDISILKGGPALILRAGVTNLQNPPSIFPKQAGGATFSSSTLPTTPGSIIVGDIDTSTYLANVTANSAILSAVGNITTRNIITTGIYRAGDILLISTAGVIDTSAGVLNAHAEAISGVGGSISFDAKSNIFTGNIDAKSNFISIISRDGFIDTTSGSLFAGGFANSGGLITLDAKGDIKTGNIESYSNFSNAAPI
ncbi:MAG TPA: filamentous hemagglutinin N-terminal domain-containing protein, partial [Coleofasciculaceae cyanobacterium]